MASRGRGRGGFGRGRGPGQPVGPVARDDDGTILPTQVSGPPPLFPPVKKLPPLPELQPKDRLLLNRRRDLLAALKSSPYFLDKHGGAGKREDPFTIEKFSDPGTTRPKRERPPLSTVLTLIPQYFPEELYSAQEKRARGSSGAAHKAFWSSQANRGSAGLNRLDQLAAQEKRVKELEESGKEVKQGGQEEAEEEGAAKKAEDGEEDVEGVVEDEEEEWADDDDDYLQGEHFDDDEGYDDDLDGGDEGAIY